jgi:DNA repair exonuclease SbcCD ATPase subunit
MRALLFTGFLAAGSLAVCLVLEWQAVLRLTSENEALRRQLDALPALLADHQQSSNRLAHANTTATESQAVELARLRRDVEDLRQTTNEIATLRADTRTTRESLKEAQKTQLASRAQAVAQQAAATNAPFQILAASYGSDRTNVDVLAELLDRMRGDTLKMKANIRSIDDPDPGQKKLLTIVYQSDGVVMTNQFHEGEVVILPPITQ